MKLFLLILISIISFSAFSQNEESYDEIKPITAEELNTAETYMHNGQAQALSDDLCANNKYSDICTNETTAFRSESLQKMEQFMPVVAKIYAMVAVAGAKEADLCAIIPAGVEAGAVVMSQIENKQIAENLDQANSLSTQAQSFHATANKHKDLRKQTGMQAAGWIAGGVCYTAKIIASLTPAALASPDAINAKERAMMYVKLGGSVAMGSFYAVKAKYHNERYKELKAIAAKLPGRGDCNPVTETSCFCSEETSQTADPANYQKYCVPAELANRTGTPTACVTATGLADPNCNCKLTNSCITTKIGKLGLELGFNGAHLQSIINGIKPLGTGFYGADFQTTTDANLAFAKKQLDKAPAATEDPNLTAEQKKTAALIASMGVPKSIAASLAKQPSADLPTSIANYNPNASTTSPVSYSKDPVMRKGKTIRKKKTNTRGSNPFARKTSKSSNGSGVEINGYIEKAQREAEIVKDTSKPIFDIISYRYKKSAWREFKSNLEEKEEVQK
jgi:hypothetical protein